MNRPEIADRSAYRAEMNRLLRIDPATTAFLTVDMQNDYLDPGCATSPLPPETARGVIRSTAHFLSTSRASGLPIIHAYVVRRKLEVARSPGGASAATFRSVSRRVGLSQNAGAPARSGPDRVEGTPQAGLPPEIVHPDDVHVTSKRVSNAFHGTELDTILRRLLGIDTLFIAGINTDTCVYATAFAANNHGFRTIVVSDCSASVRGPDHHWMALELMSRSICWVLDSREAAEKVRMADPAHEPSHI